MTSYLVTWHIEVDAETPREAAREALAIQRDHDSIATSFEVLVKDAKEKKRKLYHIDLTFPELDKVFSPK